MHHGILNYLIKEPQKIKEKYPLVLLIHGYGSNEEDLFAFAGELPDDCYIVSVRAPYPAPPYGYAWYSISFDADMNKFSDDEEAVRSRDLLVAFIHELCEKYPIDRDNVNLVGFSQGAILSYAIAVTYPEKIRKVAALSGYFNPEIMQRKPDAEAYKNLRIFGSHGTADQVIPVTWARKTAGFLEDLGISFEYKEYPVGHGVAPQNFYDFKDFLFK